MKSRIILILIVISGVGTNIQAQSKLEVSVTNIKSSEGTIRIALFDDEKDFLKKPIKVYSVKAAKDKVVVELENLPLTKYAISVFHDENNNEQLDKNWVGMPIEPYGFSNNARASFGPPSFQDASFTLTKDKTLTSISVK